MQVCLVELLGVSVPSGVVEVATGSRFLEAVLWSGGGAMPIRDSFVSSSTTARTHSNHSFFLLVSKFVEQIHEMTHTWCVVS